MSDLYYTYIHRRASDNAIFYVGKGNGKRAWSKNRSKYWKRIAAKHDFFVEICAHWPTETEAFDHEKFLIKCFRDMGCKLCNLTDGGDGISGYKYTPTPERIANNSASNIAFIKNNPDAHKERQKLATLAMQSTEARIANSKRRIKYYQENPTAKLAHSERLKNFYKKNARARLRLAKPILCIETGVIYESATDAALAVKGDHSNISAAARGKLKTSAGFHWEYVA